MHQLKTIDDIRNISAEFLSTTNPNFQYLVGSKSLLSYIGTVFYFTSPASSRYFHTSYIKFCSITDNTLTATTRNSIYMFKLLEDVADVEFFLDTDSIEKQLQERNL